MGSVSGSGRSPGEGNGYPLQCSCLEKFMDRGAWRATAHGFAKLDTTERLSTQTCQFVYIKYQQCWSYLSKVVEGEISQKNQECLILSYQFTHFPREFQKTTSRKECIPLLLLVDMVLDNLDAEPSGKTHSLSTAYPVPRSSN